jgi:CO dehydrogenase/acetyl-CoA synthase alpha subunit
MTAMADGISTLMALKMAPKSNPSDLFTTVADIQNEHESATNHIAQTTLISSVLRAVPDSYKGVITLLQLQKGNALTVEDIEKGMELMYQNSMNSSDKPTTTDGEVVLSTFIGACYKCGKVGHVKADCPNSKPAATRGRRSGTQKEPRRKCTTCGKEHAGPC